MKIIYPEKFSSKNIFIVGAGSIGTFLTAKLKDHCKVTLVTHDKKVHLFSSGIKIIEKNKKIIKKYRQFPCIGWSQIKKFPKESFVILATKIYHLPTVLPEIIKRIDGSQTIILSQNGLGVLEYAQSLVEKKSWNTSSWMRMTCWLGSEIEFKEKPVIHVSGVRGINLAQDKSIKNTAPKLLSALFTKAGISTHFLKNSLELEWKKVLANIFTNGVCTITNTPNKMVLEDSFLFQIADRLLTEAILVAKAEDVKLGVIDKHEVYQGIKIVGENINSTLQDLRAGRPTEMPWLSGAVACRGARYGIQTPANLMVYQLIQSFQRQKILLV